jgi:hypothetical protein
MKKVILLFPLILGLTVFTINCGSGKGSDVGTTAIVTASTSQTLVDGDIVKITDTNENSICGDAGDSITIPPEETITVSFNATPIINDNSTVSVSPIFVYKATIEYEPMDTDSPTIDPYTLNLGYTFTGSGELTIPIIKKEVKANFYSTDRTGNYYVKIKFKMNEINFDKDLDTEVETNLTLSNRIQEGECTP